MRDTYWAMFTAIKHYEQYYENYQIRAKRFNTIINGFCILLSFGSIASWGIWKVLPWLWGFIIGVAQVISALTPLFPFSKQIIATKYLIPEITNLLNEIAFDWDKTYKLSDSKISSLMHKYNSNFSKLEICFTGDVYFPYNKSCDNKAEIECRKFFKHYYNVE